MGPAELWPHLPWQVVLSCNSETCLMVFPGQDPKLHKKTLKRTRKFVVDGVEVSITTSKIISEDEKKDEEMRFLRQAWEGPPMVVRGWGYGKRSGHWPFW